MKNSKTSARRSGSAASTPPSNSGAAAGSIAPGQSRGPPREIIPEFGVQDEHMEELGLAKADTSKLARGGVASKPRA